MRLLCVALFLTLLTAGCAEKPRPPIELAATQYNHLLNWQRDDHSAAFTAFLRSCDVWKKRSKDKMVGCNGLQTKAANWQNICKIATNVDPEYPDDIRHFFESQFTPRRVSIHGSRRDSGLFTGYYIPEIRGSLKRGGPYQTPVYGKPNDLKKGKEYYTRAQINDGKLAGRGLEIAWVNDPVQLFFIEIQGSGVIRLAEGGLLSIGYAAKNNHSYTAIGRVMRERELLDKENINLFTIKDWLYQNPSKARTMMEENASFVFFRPLPDNKIRGAQGSHLTAERSLAIDKGYIPYGMPVYLQTSLPETRFGPAKPFNRLMIAQDTGGAIKGGIRGDIYFGHGEHAEALAGNQQQEGGYTLLVPKVIAERQDISIISPCTK